MSENKQGEKGLFELLEERCPDFQAQDKANSRVSEYNFSAGEHGETHNFEFLVQDMFLDHFFP